MAEDVSNNIQRALQLIRLCCVTQCVHTLALTISSTTSSITVADVLSTAVRVIACYTLYAVPTVEVLTSCCSLLVLRMRHIPCRR
jgi:hypothetical protein